MTGQQLRWTAEQVMALAPDAASQKAGSKLSAPAPWSETGQCEGALWGLCKGSGKTPYRTAVDFTDPAAPAYACSCPSRKFPCKHALGLLLLSARDTTAVPTGPLSPPEWVAGWLSGRRDRAGAAAATGGHSPGRAPADPAAARKRAERRARRIAAGTEELEQRLADLLHGGLAGADRSGYAGWDEMAARMVDAQAPGLAARVRELAGIPASGTGWPSRLLAECSLLHLLNRGCLRLDALPGELAATVRSRVGLSIDSAALLAEHSERGTLVRDHWLVLGSQDRREDRLTVRRIWLFGTGTGRMALLLAFGTGQTAPELALPPGVLLDASLAFYPGGAPLRAALGERHAQGTAGPEPPGTDPAGALAAYGRALAADPWLESWPVVLSGVIPLPAPADGPGGWQLAAQHGEAALPLHPASGDARWVLAAISGGHPVTVFGECGHEGFLPHTVWSEGKEVPL
jgi:hypothetical protein